MNFKVDIFLIEDKIIKQQENIDLYIPNNEFELWNPVVGLVLRRQG